MRNAAGELERISPTLACLVPDLLDPGDHQDQDDPAKPHLGAEGGACDHRKGACRAAAFAGPLLAGQHKRRR
jgi:hypothetical protein